MAVRTSGSQSGGTPQRSRYGLGGESEEGRIRCGDDDGHADFLDAFADFHELGGAGRGVDLEAAAFGPGIGGVVVADPGEEGVGAAAVQYDAEVAGDAGGPEVAVAGAVDAVKLEAGGGGIDLEVEGGLLGGGRFPGGETGQGGGEGVGNAQGHRGKKFLIPVKNSKTRSDTSHAHRMHIVCTFHAPNIWPRFLRRITLPGRRWRWLRAMRPYGTDGARAVRGDVRRARRQASDSTRACRRDRR